MRQAGSRGPTPLRFWRILAGYLLFGLGSIGYMTFIYGHLAESAGGWRQAMLFWCALGLAAVAAPSIWRRLIGGASPERSFALLVATNALGSVLPFLMPGALGLWLSAFLFGSTFFSTVAATSAFASALPQAFDRAARSAPSPSPSRWGSSEARSSSAGRPISPGVSMRR